MWQNLWWKYLSTKPDSLEQLEQISLASEENGGFSVDDVNEIFRAMHTIKGSAAMMMLMRCQPWHTQ